MEIRDIYYVVAILVIIVTGVGWMRESISSLKGENDLIKQDMQNQKEKLHQLEQQVDRHEEKIDNRLSAMNNTIKSNHKEVTDTLTDIKLSIERLKPRTV